MKILIVDDEDSIRTYVSIVVSELGYEPITAENGKIGLEKFKQNRPNLIICDMIMPVMNGRELIEKVRQLPEGRTIPIIILSGYAKISEVAKLLELGATYFLKKPVEFLEFKEYIKMSLLTK